MLSQRQLGGRFGVDVGEAADGSGEPHTEFDLQRATSEDRAPAPYVGESRRSCANLRRCVPQIGWLMWAMHVVRGLFSPRPSSRRSQPGSILAAMRYALSVAIGPVDRLGGRARRALRAEHDDADIVRMLVPASIVASRSVAPRADSTSVTASPSHRFDRGDGAVLPSRGRSRVPARRRLRRRRTRRLARARHPPYRAVEIAWVGCSSRAVDRPLLLAAAAMGHRSRAHRRWARSSCSPSPARCISSPVAGSSFVPAGCGRARPPRPRRSGAPSPRPGAGVRARPSPTPTRLTSRWAHRGSRSRSRLTRKIEMIQRLGRSGTKPSRGDDQVLVTPTRPVSPSRSPRIAASVGRCPVRGGPSPSP